MQLFKAAQSDRFEGPTDSGERKGQQVCDAPERAAVMAQGIVEVHKPWLKCPPLAAANSAAIHQSCGTTLTFTALTRLLLLNTLSRLHVIAVSA